jgi:murein DD-endopeptidase MepM/ murein hydrolase activator NlpD
VIEKFGRHKHPELGTTYISNGIIINLKQSQPVHAAADGQALVAHGLAHEP